jgi:hypothetical protein
MIWCASLYMILGISLWLTASSGKARSEGANLGFRLGLAFLGYVLQHGIPIFTRQPLSALH